jgi:hypothetical protein
MVINLPWIQVRLEYLLFHGHRRAEHPAGAADHLPDAHLDPVFLGGGPRAGQGLHDLLPAAGSGHGGRVPGPGPVPVLHLLGVHAGADVLPDRHLGRPAAHVRGHQVLPVHHGRLDPDAAGHHLAGAGGWHLRVPELIANLNIPAGAQTWLFLAFTAAFAIKVPMWPLHSWLPDAHVEAPTAGSVILAGVLLKMGTYGFLRFNIPLFPQAASPSPRGSPAGGDRHHLRRAVSYAQRDAKKLVAYSSVSHLGFVMLGLFALNQQGIQGGILQMINHGLSTGALFLLVGMIYDRRHTREMDAYGGLWKVMPVYAVFTLIVTLSSMGLPGLNGFVGEFTILLGAFGSEAIGSPWFAGSPPWASSWRRCTCCSCSRSCSWGRSIKRKTGSAGSQPAGDRHHRTAVGVHLALDRAVPAASLSSP